MVWFERYSMRFVCPLISMAAFDPNSSFDNKIEIVFDAYGDLNGVNYKGQRVPMPREIIMHSR